MVSEKRRVFVNNAITCCYILELGNDCTYKQNEDLHLLLLFGLWISHPVQLLLYPTEALAARLPKYLLWLVVFPSANVTTP